MKHLGVMVTTTVQMVVMNYQDVILLVLAMPASVHQLTNVFLHQSCVMIIKIVLMTVMKSTALVQVTNMAALMGDVFTAIGCVTVSRTVRLEMTSCCLTALVVVPTNFNVPTATSV
jgi:hypothetical protein